MTSEEIEKQIEALREKPPTEGNLDRLRRARTAKESAQKREFIALQRKIAKMPK